MYVSTIARPSSLRVSLLKAPDVHHNGQISIPKSLLLYLTTSRPGPVQHSSLIRSLCNRNTTTSTHGHFHISLAHLEHIIPLIRTSSHIKLSTGRIRISVALVRGHLTRVSLRPSIRARITVLGKLVNALNVILFPRTTHR